MIKAFKFSAKGARHTNEDFIFFQELPDSGSIFLLADGMGGYHHGEIAASLACASIAQYLSKNIQRTDIPGSIVLAIQAANNSIGKQRRELGEKLGTTIAGVLIEKDRAFFYWLGDVRIYHFRDMKILFQSEDHSLVNDMKKQGTVTASDILRYSNIVTRSIMGENILESIPVIEMNLLPGDKIVLCTDGLWQNWDIRTLLNMEEASLTGILLEKESNNSDNYSLFILNI